MSQLEVDKIVPQSGTTLTIGDSGDTITISAGATLSGSLNADNLDSGTVPSARVSGAYTGITQTGTLTSFASTGIDDNATSTAITINSSQNVGIGTSSPGGYKLNVNGLSNFSGYSNWTSGTHLYWNGGDVGITNAGTNLVFKTYDGSSLLERVRIDSSGNLLVGTTNSNVYNTTGDEGIAIKTNNLQIQRSNNTPLYVNRTVSDGSLISLRQDGTEVGSINARSSFTTLQIGSLGTGITGTSSHSILPSVSNARSDNTNDLGSATYRWKDIYLSGGAYIGGTGSANKLDDYEEGTWTPDLSTVGGTLSVTYAERAGKYTKIGELVQWECYIETSAFSGGTGAITFGGLPFTVESGRGAIGIAHGSRIDFGLEAAVTRPLQNTSTFRISIKNSTGTQSSDNSVSLDASDWSNLNPTLVYATGQYRTDS